MALKDQSGASSVQSGPSHHQAVASHLVQSVNLSVCLSALSVSQRLAEALLRFVKTRLQPGVLSVCLRTLRILSRDRQALSPFITDSSILTLAYLSGIRTTPLSQHDDEGEEKENVDHVDSNPISNVDFYGHFTDANSAAPRVSSTPSLTTHCVNEDIMEMERSDGIHGVLARGKRDTREEEEEERSEWCDDGEVWRKEAMKTLCNVIYNSQRAQERASALRSLSLSLLLNSGPSLFRASIHLPPMTIFIFIRLKLQLMMWNVSFCFHLHYYSDNVIMFLYKR